MATTTTIGIPYPQDADDNDTPLYMSNLAGWLDPVIEGSYTQTEINAFTATQKWTDRRVWNSTRGVEQRWNGTAWVDIQAVSINTQAGAYTLVLGDSANVFLKMTSATNVALTVPLNATVAFPIGQVISGVQYGAGQITITPTGGVTINPTTRTTRAQYSPFTLIKMGTDEWLLTGDLV